MSGDRRAGPGGYRFGQSSLDDQQIIIGSNINSSTEGSGGEGKTDSSEKVVCRYPQDQQCPKPQPFRLPTLWIKISVTVTVVVCISILIQVGIAIDRNYLCDACSRPWRPADAAEGLPRCAIVKGGYCVEAQGYIEAIQYARYYLNRGDAEAARQRWSSALSFYRLTMEVGRDHGAQAALEAARRIRYLSLPCAPQEEPLRRISRDWDKNPLGAKIELKTKKQALAALGYEPGPIDNQHNNTYRDAVSGFQSDLWYDENSVLTAEQTVLLICSAASISDDIDSMNALGIMYATGLGVNQNTDTAVHWFQTAARRGSGDASWNLALLFGTGTVASSVKLCDATENAERADSYMTDAYVRRHPAAERIAANPDYDGDDPDIRWQKIKRDLNVPNSLTLVGKGCTRN